MVIGDISDLNFIFSWAHGLLFHQAFVDSLRSSLLLPVADSILHCKLMSHCGVLETSFILLVTASTINLLATVLNDSPVLNDDKPKNDDNKIECDIDEIEYRWDYENEYERTHNVVDSHQCVLFGIFMIWFSSFTIHLGPTFLSGALVADINDLAKVQTATCPLVWGPFRHYILNLSWVAVNILCLLLTLFHLRQIYNGVTRSSSEAVDSLISTIIENKQKAVRTRRTNSNTFKQALSRIRMFLIVVIGYFSFWGPLFLATLLKPDTKEATKSQRIALNFSLIHAFINPMIYIVFQNEIRNSIIDVLCCRAASKRNYSFTFEEKSTGNVDEIFYDIHAHVSPGKKSKLRTNVKNKPKTQYKSSSGATKCRSKKQYKPKSLMENNECRNYI